MISRCPTGMVYAQTRRGYRRFYRLTMTTVGAMTAIQALLCIPALSHALFARLIGLPPSIEAPAQITPAAEHPPAGDLLFPHPVFRGPVRRAEPRASPA